MMLLLAAPKRVIRADRAVRSGRWGWRNRLEPGEISGKRLLIVGYGRSGRHLARMADGFGMEIRAFDPFLVERGLARGAGRARRRRWPMGLPGPTSFRCTRRRPTGR